MALKRKRDPVGTNTSKGIRKTEEVEDPKVHPLGTSWANLPHDILTNILLKLPIKSVLMCKFTCKLWHSIISDPYFAQMHFECAPISALVRISNPRHAYSRTLHLLDFDEFKSNEAQNLPSSNDYGHACSCKGSLRSNCHNHMKIELKFKLPLHDSKIVPVIEIQKRVMRRRYQKSTSKDEKFDVVNSCNGLLCLCDLFERNPLAICNPITGEFIGLPQSENDKLMRVLVHSGLGYLKRTNEYQVIRIYDQTCFRDLRCPYAATEILTLGTQLWRHIEYHGPYWSTIRSPTCLNGSLYWLVYNETRISILRFDLESETFNSLPCPSRISHLTLRTEKAKSRIGFGQLKGSLYICCRYAGTKCLRFWTMKMCGVGQSWIEFLKFDHDDSNNWPHLYKPIIGSADPGILIYDPPRFFIYYEPQKQVFRCFKGCGTSNKLEPTLHIPSLIRLKDVVKGDNIEVLNVHSRCAASKLREDNEVLYLTKADLGDMSIEVLNF